MTVLDRSLVLLCAWALLSGELAAAELRLVPTFENCSVYVEGSGSAPSQVQVRCRELGTQSWLRAHPLVTSSDDPVPRGSLFGLKSGTGYEVECTDMGGTVVAAGRFRTWDDVVPVAKTIRIGDLAKDRGRIVISQSGSAEGWIRYVAGDGEVIDGGEADAEAILIRGAAYIILDGLTVRGGMRHGVHVEGGHHIRVIGCDISGFGRVGTQDLSKDGKYYDQNGKVINNDAGVFIDRSGETVVERCFIHDPRGHANSWFYAHPVGPNAIFVKYALGGTVLRYNDLIGSDRHRWNDVIEGLENGKVDGGFNCDSDIYGNLLAYSNDDGIELDGGQCNVRFYGNRIEGSLCGVSTAPNLRGPSYVFANVIADLGDERGEASSGIKNGGGDLSKGKTFFYHNTFVGPGSGVAGVGYGKRDETLRFLGVTRNNIFAVSRMGISDIYAPAECDYDFDLFATPGGAPGNYSVPRAIEAHGVISGAGLLDPAAGDCRLSERSAARGAGTRIAGFEWFQAGDQVDIGAVPGHGGVRSVPWRRTPITAQPSRIRFTDAGADALAHPRTVIVTLDKPSSGQRFTVVPLTDSDWMQVTPAAGELPLDRPLTLQVALTERIWERKGSARGGFSIRLSNGESLPVTVAADVRRIDFRVSVEAESLAGASAFATGEAADASQGRFLTFVKKEGAPSGEPAGLLMEASVPEAGLYSVAVRIRCQDPINRHDSIFLAIDDAKPVACSLSGAGSWQWALCPVAGKGSSMIWLEQGPHRFRIHPRESLDLDAAMLSSTTVSADGGR